MQGQGPVLGRSLGVGRCPRGCSGAWGRGPFGRREQHAKPQPAKNSAPPPARAAPGPYSGPSPAGCRPCAGVCGSSWGRKHRGLVRAARVAPVPRAPLPTACWPPSQHCPLPRGVPSRRPQLSHRQIPPSPSPPETPPGLPLCCQYKGTISQPPPAAPPPPRTAPSATLCTRVSRLRCPRFPSLLAPRYSEPREPPSPRGQGLLLPAHGGQGSITVPKREVGLGLAAIPSPAAVSLGHLRSRSPSPQTLCPAKAQLPRWTDKLPGHISEVGPAGCSSAVTVPPKHRPRGSGHLTFPACRVPRAGPGQCSPPPFPHQVC